MVVDASVVNFLFGSGLSRLGQTNPNSSKDRFRGGFCGWLYVILQTHMLVVRKSRQVGVVRSIVPADEQDVVCIEPVICVSLHDVVIVLFADPERAAVAEGRFKFESVVINSQNSNLYHELGQYRPDTGDSSLQERAQGDSPEDAAGNLWFGQPLRGCAASLTIR